ncbi:AAA family ATPase [Beggiatoa leptomitoformis]|uniref:AAA family ATPase n=1 Tax=Beggiatoa leptomitoformis TaxID=288004 RepID=A0A2N9YD48_9GAMM|nr:AAA family ATPase [Beggiatoa leptomitoformis]ALG69190.1 AAA family ATPase [Beggiatoa leptomitoformis]AUI68381.1 AAA family ATPase [Beggiatoa leptomitoformis]
MDSKFKQLYNTFSPEPLPAGDEKYVDFQAVRGGSDVLQLAHRIELSDKTMTCQLYSGHMGGGKTTELYRLVEALRQLGYQVVYFSAGGMDVEPEDARYTDVLLACVRYLLQDLKAQSTEPLYHWLKERWDGIKEFLNSQVELNLELEAKLPLAFAELSSTIKVNPSVRSKIRDLLDPYTVTLVEALNEFIRLAKPDSHKLVLIVDGLDKIVKVVTDESTGRTNLEEIFIDRSEQLKRLACHVVYTVPISLAHSTSAVELENRYGQRVEILPMITIRKRGTKELCECGLKTLSELIEKRLQVAALTLTDFLNEADLKRLCLMSGGHTRNLVQLVRTALEYSSSFPLSTKAVDKAIAQMRDTMRRSIDAHEWEKLAEVHRDQDEKNYRDLLFRRVILEYRDDDETTWHDIHPLIEEIEEFKTAMMKIIE